MSSTALSATSITLPFVDLEAQYQSIAPEVEAAVLESLRRTDYILGHDVTLFEQEFAAFCGTGFAVGMDSGLSALELLLRAYEIGPGDEVITPANSFVATALAISSAGAKPVLVDIDPVSYNIDVDLLESAITPRTKAIMPVHLYGQPAEMDAIMALADRHGFVVIEDACQAHGARLKARRAGALGHAGAFSFYPAKNLGAFGDAGMAVTNDAEIADRLRMLRNYGQREKYRHLVQGFNRRLDTLQAAALRVKLKHLDRWNEARRRHAALYRELLQGQPLVLPEATRHSEPIWHLFVIRSSARDELRAWLTNQQIGTGIHYPVPIHLQPAYRALGYRLGDFPITEQYADEVLSLPMYAELTPDLITRVADAIKSFHSMRLLPDPADVAQPALLPQRASAQSRGV